MVVRKEKNDELMVGEGRYVQMMREERNGEMMGEGGEKRPD